MNIRAAIEAARAMPCNRQRLEQLTGLSPVAVRRLVIQMRREFGMRIEWNRSDGYIILDWGCISPDKLSKGKGGAPVKLPKDSGGIGGSVEAGGGCYS